MKTLRLYFLTIPFAFVQLISFSQFSQDHQIDFKSPFGIQGLEYIPQKKSFQVHSHAEIFYQINDRFEKESMVIGRASFELQDLALLNKNTIISNNRDAQTIEFAKIK